MSCCGMECEDRDRMRRNEFNKSFAHNALRLQSVLRLINWVVSSSPTNEWDSRSFEFL